MELYKVGFKVEYDEEWVYIVYAENEEEAKKIAKEKIEGWVDDTDNTTVGEWNVYPLKLEKGCVWDCWLAPNDT